MKSRSIPVITIVASLAALGGMALAAQDKYTVQVPGGLAFEDWQAVAVSQPEDRLNVIVANPAMIDAYRAGAPGNGKPFPDGSKIAKITWNSKQNAESPFSVNVPDTLAGIGFIVKDSTRFSDTGGWGYAQFDYDPASDTFTPDASLQGNDAKLGVRYVLEGRRPAKSRAAGVTADDCSLAKLCPPGPGSSTTGIRLRPDVRPRCDRCMPRSGPAKSRHREAGRDPKPTLVRGRRPSRAARCGGHPGNVGLKAMRA
jgi:hypothetical protein